MKQRWHLVTTNGKTFDDQNFETQNRDYRLFSIKNKGMPDEHMVTSVIVPICNTMYLKQKEA